MARVELESLAQGFLVAGLGQAAGLGRHELVEKALDRGRRLSTHELGDDLPVLEGLHRWDALDAELLRDLLVRVGVDLRELDLAIARSHRLFESWAQGPARAAPLGPEVDDHRNLL